jgi:hypothetical protein
MHCTEADEYSLVTLATEPGPIVPPRHAAAGSRDASTASATDE